MPNKIYIKTLTPIHVGTGKSISEIEYLIESGYFYRLYFDFLSETAYNSGNTKFIEWITEISSRMSADRISSDELSRLRKDFNLIKFINKNLNNSISQNQLLEKSLYKIPCDSLGDKKLLMEGIKTSNNEFYIPGSSLKGALRTALLNRVVKSFSNDIINNINRLISQDIKRIEGINDNKKKDREKKRLKGKVGNYLEHEAFYCGLKKNNRGGEDIIRFDDEKFDLLKIVSLSDSTSIPCDSDGKICLIDLFKTREDETQSQTPAVECINSNVNLSATIRIDTKFIQNAKKLLDNRDRIFGNSIWIKFKDKFERLFNLRLEELNGSNIEDKILNSVFESIKEYSSELKSKELKWIEKKSKNNSRQFLYLKKYYEDNITGNSLKLGYGSGFPGTTSYLSLLNNDNLKTTYKKLLEFFEIGAPRPKPDNWELYIDNFPTSKRLHSDDSEITSLGWIQFALNEKDLIEIKNPVIEISREKPAGSIESIVKRVEDNKVIIEVNEGDNKGRETFISGFRQMALDNLGIKIGDIVYVSLSFNKKGIIEKADYKGKV
jgi:CRISPR-associated protein Csm5